jgi:hypothetical protein
MEVRGHQPSGSSGAESAHQRFERARVELAEANRERIRRARDERVSFAREAVAENRATSPTRDRLDLSAAAERASEPDPARSERVAELARLAHTGELHTPERTERAAERLLGA